MKKLNLILCISTVAVLGGGLIGILWNKNKKERITGFDDDLFNDDNFDEELRSGNIKKNEDSNDLKSDKEHKGNPVEEFALCLLDVLLEEALQKDKKSESVCEIKEDVDKNREEIISLWEHIESLSENNNEKDRG